MTRFFFHVSGEHNTLPYAEVKAILESESLIYENVESFPKLLCLESNASHIPSVSNRASFLKAYGVEIFRCEATDEEMIHHIREEAYDKYISKGQTFSVRAKKLQKSSAVNVEKLERELGRIILEKTGNIKVGLDNPDKTFLAFLTENLLIFGLRLAESSREDFQKRSLRKRPFFHPSAMSPKLGRCMVNLARCKPDSVILDPFCGTGSILIEAGLIGCKALGSDMNKKMVRGSLRNLRFFRIHNGQLCVADARNLPFRKIDNIITDPPYGRSSSTFGENTKSVVTRFLSSATEALKKGGYISICLPDYVDINEICEALGNYGIIEEHLVKEHKSLTRKISVLINNN